MTTVAIGDHVKVHYTGTLEDGEVFDSSLEREPLEFEVGAGQVIAGFDQGIEGMEAGESRRIEVPADQAYGERNEEIVFPVPKDQFPPDISPSVGDRFQVQVGEDQVIEVGVAEINDDSITLDANHPLAGKNLIFEVTLVEIVEA
ncbi:MAG: peptidylprolyl isomerase [Methanocalculus sp. MSAO_Arc1]|uniref:FKBP-type peptidyl-prolyl cis-trans isomerase n=1 Tax=Methanocalculus TaxID=71151 RepID=UPI000FEFF861|nr:MULTISPECIES: peptidylprolyl isomerase [unclassified Methanocalculus]MCP1662480.1 peptidylprolyl isomerase [Methanocalculus sp. AMF5]RQD80823.1 MAG: peptidylprolyl isomerase [Methanocalculus sp. MSAO_Arc1]